MALTSLLAAEPCGRSWAVSDISPVAACAWALHPVTAIRSQLAQESTHAHVRTQAQQARVRWPTRTFVRRQTEGRAVSRCKEEPLALLGLV